MSSTSPAKFSTGESNKNGFKWRLSEPKVFSGCPSNGNEDLCAEALNWLNKFERIKATGKMDDEEIMFIVGDYLDKKAGTWFNVIGKKAKTWSEFVTLFKKQYLVDQEDKWWSQLQSMKQGPDDTIDDVALKMEELFNYLNNTNASYQVRTFLSAIDPKVAYEIEKEGTPATFLIAKTKAKQIEKSKNKYHFNYSNETMDSTIGAKSSSSNSVTGSDISSADSVFGARSDVSSLVAKLEQLSINLVKLNESQQKAQRIYPSAAGGNANSYSNGRVYTCYFCNEPGHKKYDCPKMLKENPPITPATGSNAIPLNDSFSGKDKERL